MAYTAPEIDLMAAAGTLPAGSSYVLVVDADAYFVDSFNNAAWMALTTAEKTVALAEATRWLEALCWKGEKCDPAQPMQWPRQIDATGCCAATDCTTLPAALVQATSELALALHKDQDAVIGGAATAVTGLVKRQKLGDLEVEYHPPSSGTVTTSRFGPKSPVILQKFPWLWDLIGCWAHYSGASQLAYRVRS